jgi:FkbH-like protein
MTLNQALQIIKSSPGTGAKRPHFLVCGFEPLHLKTLLHAHLLENLPDFDPELSVGLYGDLPGNLALAAASSAVATAVVLEWSDIDPRMGLRSAGGWSGEVKADILSGLPARYARLVALVQLVGAKMPVALAPPSLPLPPFGNTVNAQASVLELELEAGLSAFLVQVARLPGVRVLSPHLIAKRVPSDAILDPRAEFIAGFPYTVACADALADALSALLWQVPPKKGLITDLDDTLWAGIVGETGPGGVSWHQESYSQVHGLYQQMLGHLASCGVLLGVASKNDIAMAEAALGRSDLLLNSASLFPVCANWGPKSASVATILQTWNIAADSVVFVDDSPLELEEVRQAFPGITCVHFPRKEPVKVWNLLNQLRDLFGKPVLTEEDALRQASIRAGALLQEAVGDGRASPDFLSGLDGLVTFQWNTDPADKRPLELLNKTNQFNLNGLRISEGEWQQMLSSQDRITAVISYQDKFGPLGKVAVVTGSAGATTFCVSHWVMSCRAFSRMLEHHTLDALFRYSGAEWIEFDYRITDRNSPIQQFLANAGIAADHSGLFRVARKQIGDLCSSLPHTVTEITKG